MFKKMLPLMISLVLLCGCADTGEESFDQFARSVAESDSVCFSADVRAEYSDKTAEFTLRYAQSADSAEVEISEPETVAGIKARVTGDALSLEYDGAILDIGSFGDTELSPMSALPLLVRSMTDAHIDITWREDDMIAARLVPSDDMLVTLWLSNELVPLNAEISYKEQTVIFIEINNWEVE